MFKKFFYNIFYMFRLKNNNIDFECYPANFQGYNNQSAYICTQSNIIENFESSSSFLKNVKFVRLAPSGEGSDTATQGANDLELSQIVIKDENGNNIAKNSKITGSPKLHPSQNQSWTVNRLISGDEKATDWPNVFAAQANGKFFVEVELANPSNVSEVNIYSRSDNPAPLNGEFTQVVWFLDSNRKVLTKRSMPGINLNPRIIKNLGPPNAVPGSVKFVRVERTDPNSTQGFVQFYQLMVLDGNNTNVAYGQLVTAPHSHRPPEHGVDNFDGEKEPSFNRNGNKLVHSHGGRKGDFYEIELASPTAVKQIKLYNRGDYSEPISHFKVMLLDSNRRELFSNNFNKENLQIINVNGPASVASGTAPVSSGQGNKEPKIFVAGGDGHKLAYSTNGTDWTKATLPAGYNGGINSIAYDGKIMITGAWVGDNTGLMFSTDGKTWEPHTVANTGWTTVVNVSYCKDRFVVCALLNNGKWGLAYSMDGMKWEQAPRSNGVLQNNNFIWRCAYGAGVFVIILRDGNGAYLAYSDDFNNWKECNGTRNLFNDGFSITHNGKIFVCVGAGNSRFIYSTDGINWNQSQSGNSQSNGIGRGVVWANNLWVATFSNGNTPVLTSQDGINWNFSQASRGMFEHAMYSAWAGDKWLIAGNGRCKLATTTDFNSYTKSDSGHNLFDSQILSIISATLNVKTFPTINCGNGNIQVGTSCYPDFLINKK